MEVVSDCDVVTAVNDVSASTEQCQSASSRWATLWVALTILLVLHWSAPGVLRVHAPAGWSDVSPGFSVGGRAGQPGTLPRLFPQTISLDSSLPKQPRQRGWNVKGDDGDALITWPFAHQADWQPLVSLIVFGRTLLPQHPTSAFQARAPPTLLG